MEHVDAVVVGSGFGGAVAACRLAEAGLSVVVLERGRAYAPGDFPRGPAQLGRAFWDPAEGLYGMFDIWSFSDCDSVVASGLGGGSLIYANVMLRKDEDWFVHEQALPGGGYESWPVTRADLEPHYDAVERMIGVSPYPLSHPGFDDTLKTLAMRDAAAELGLDWRLPPLAVSFAPSPGAQPCQGAPLTGPAYGNLHGVPRRTCRLCGECDLGCNDGAKNSLDHTYLSAARHHGADLRTLHEVRRIRPRMGGGYDVQYVEHMPRGDEAREDGDGPPRWTGPHTISCDRLVLAAGTYGTSYLLLKNRAAFPGLSGTIGSRFCGNGDMLAFLLRATDRSRTRPIRASRGPVITSAIRLDDGADGRGAYIEDGGYPEFVDYLVEGADMGPGRVARFLLRRLRNILTHDTNLSAEFADLIGRGELSGTSLPLLGMGRDVPDGRLRLRDGRLDVDWTTETSEDYYERLRAIMRRIGDVLGAEYADSPPWWRRRVMTVHPLGGAPMGRHPGEGVCDAYGEVFGFPGLYVADGAALPGPVGANPSLTIAALADRMSTRILESRASLAAPSAAVETVGVETVGAEAVGVETVALSAVPPIEVGAEAVPVGTAAARPAAQAGAVPDCAVPDCAVPVGSVEVQETMGTPETQAAPEPTAVSGGRPFAAGRADEPSVFEGRTSLWFVEEMRGILTPGPPGRTARGSGAGGCPFAFRLTITIDDIDRFLTEPEHEARAEGWIEADLCGGRRPIARGSFNLFVPGETAGQRRMCYRLRFWDADGRPRTLAGHKEILPGAPTRLWLDTSTLHARLLEGHVEEDGDEDAAVVAAGTLRIMPSDLVRMLTTFRTAGPDGTAAVTRFCRFFLGELWEVYGPAQGS
ncbi:GMC oxidoreductase [Microbispora catharanthi]|uniref:Cholesterol oxidase n=1 Tax=Microbispora catharanthi TaxID=1712871 RepID=A0A5N6BVT2_9ACTN|nr:GMC family oxidoreductase [Microbispora catharanthi]KAB8184604.1 FAD-binding protein [Microbispora catharanthi]